MSEKKVATLNKYQINKSLRSKIKKSIPKPVLCTPYKIIWPSLEAKTQEKILSALTKFFTDYDFKNTAIDASALKGLTKAERKAKRTEHSQKLKQSVSYKLRKCLAIGINEVTRMMEGNIRVVTKMEGDEEDEDEPEEGHGNDVKKEDEKIKNIAKDEIVSDAKVVGHSNSHEKPKYKKDTENNITNIKNKNKPLPKKVLSILFVDRSSPWQLHRHLIQMAAIAKCPAVAIDNLSDRISPLLSLTRLCALGFKKEYVDKSQLKEDAGVVGTDEKVFEAVVELISPLCPAIELPWMECEDYLMNIKRGGPGSDDVVGKLEQNDNGVKNEQDDDDDGGDKDVEMEDEAESTSLSYNDLYIIKGVNEGEFKELLSLRKKSAFVEKDLQLMMFNYAPNKPSFSPPPFDMASVFYTKKPDKRVTKKNGDKSDNRSDDGVSSMKDQLGEFVSTNNGASIEKSVPKNRKRKFTDDVVKKVQKNEFKKKRKNK